MLEILKFIIILAAGIFGGYMFARAKTFDDYNEMYSHLTCEIVSRMTRAMRSIGFRQEDIDLIIQRMGCKIMPTAVLSPPPAPPEKKPKEDTYVRDELVRLLNENDILADQIHWWTLSEEGREVKIRLKGLKFMLKDNDTKVE